MKTLIVFTIKSQRVHQMIDSGHTGQDEIDEVKDRFAGIHKVSHGEVRVSFEDKAGVISSEMVKAVKLELEKKEIRN